MSAKLRAIQRQTYQPKPETNFTLYYRGKPMPEATDVSRAECIGIKNQKVGTGCFMKEHFDIKPATT